MGKTVLGYEDFNDHAFKDALSIVRKSKKILVWGDEDPDGMTATTILLRALKDSGYEADYFIPARKSDGIGLNIKQLNRILKDPFDLVITVDCGTSCTDEVEYLLRRKINVIITDHHVPYKKTIKDVPYINPHIIKTRKFKNLSGAGVSLIFSTYLRKHFLKKRSYTDALISDKKSIMLAGIGTVCDKVKTTGFNKYLEKEYSNLKQYYPTLSNYLKNKMDLCGIFHQSKTIRNTNPIVNILTNSTENSEKSKKAIKRMRDQNRDEMLSFDKIYKKEIEKINKNADVIIHVSNSINSSYLGLLAGRVSAAEKKPVLIIGKKGDEYAGEARSVIKFNWITLFKKFEKHFNSWGGHKMAAGFSLPENNIDCFISDIRNYIKL